MPIKKRLSECCGCTACVSICPQNAIKMKPNEMGFVYPIVDYSICTRCGLCDKICNFKKDYKIVTHLEEPLAYIVRHKDICEIETSRSGAVFIALSDWVLDNDGVVYGVGFSQHFVVSHQRATNKRERDNFKGSKYVQSNLDGIFVKIKDDLEKGKLVLFSGTPCQVSGLQSYIGEILSTNLYTIDIICHGVPSPKLWSDYLSYIERLFGKNITKIDFRDKKFGWASHFETITFDDNTDISVNTFTELFYHEFHRRTCSVCPFANLKRVSDITIGDCWGWEQVNKEFNKDNKGCSLVIVNTEKGNRWFNSITKDINFIQTSTEKVLQPNLYKPTEPEPCFDQFESEYKKKGFRFIVRKYSNAKDVLNDCSLLYKIIRKIKSLKRMLISKI